MTTTELQQIRERCEASIGIDARVHLLSGGMDSVVLLYDLVGQGCVVFPVIFDYGQTHKKELRFAKLHCERLQIEPEVISIPPLRGSTLTDGAGSIVVPFRNPIILSHAVNVACASNVDTVTIGCNRDDEETFPDCRRLFIDSMNNAVKAAGYSVQICAPYLDKTKREVAEIGKFIGVDFGDTWSCYAGGESECGACSACQKKLEALS